MNTVLLCQQIIAKPLSARFILSGDEEEGSGSIADKGIGSPKKEKDPLEKEVDPEEILDQTDGTGFPMAKEKGETDPGEEERMEETL